MSSIEELNVTALERWMHEVFEEGNLDLAVELMAPSYVGHMALRGQLPTRQSRTWRLSRRCDRTRRGNGTRSMI